MNGSVSRNCSETICPWPLTIVRRPVAAPPVDPVVVTPPDPVSMDNPLAEAEPLAPAGEKKNLQSVDAPQVTEPQKSLDSVSEPSREAQSETSSESDPDLNPGESKEVSVPIQGFEGKAHISIYKPTGFLTTETEFVLE